MTSSSSSLDITCPEGGDFYLCEDTPTQFIGCCTADPCSDNTGVCEPSNLRTTSFNANYYASIEAQSCAAPYDNNSFYTCTGVDPPFLGCCSSNPCHSGGCPSEDLLAAELSEIQANADSFVAAAQPNANNGDEGGLSTGAIAGIAAGGAVVVFLILGFIMFRCGWLPCFRRGKKDQKEPEESKTLYNNMNGEYSPALTSPWHNSEQHQSYQSTPMLSPGRISELGSPPQPSHASAGAWGKPPHQKHQHHMSSELDGRHVSEMSGATAFDENVHHSYEQYRDASLAATAPTELDSQQMQAGSTTATTEESRPLFELPGVSAVRPYRPAEP